MNGDKLIIDSFAGGGGASTGIEMALGRSPDYAINHSADALAMHEVNHPATVHLDSNIWDVSPSEVTRGRPVGLFWASPDCKHFSKAKGGKPLDRNIRDLAWVVVRWAEEVSPDVIILENVEEFVTWGPLYEDGRPIVELRGQTFEDWTRRLKKAGYKVQWRELRACDYGAPTIRKRFFMIARRDGMPIVWPARTHGDPKKPADAKLIAAGKLKPYRTAAEIIDWSLPCPSIFDTSEEIMAKFGLRAVRPLADATMKRIARGVVRYVLEAKRPFVVPVAHAGDARVNSVDEPVRTQTGHSRSDHAVVVPSLVKNMTNNTPDGPDEPVSTVLTGNHHMLTVPFAVRTDMASAADRNGVNTLEEPMRTQTTAGSHAVVVPTFVGCGGRAGQSAPRGGDEPTGTLTAKADGCVVAAHLTSYYGDGEGGKIRGSAPDAPLSTDTAGGNRHGVVAGYLVPRYGERGGQEPRTRSVEEPAPVIVPDGNGGSLAAVHLSRFTQNGVGSAADEPVDTVMAGAPKFGVVSAFLAQHNNDTKPSGVDFARAGRSAEEPLSALTTSPQQAVVAAFMAQHNTGVVGHDARDPISTLTTGGSYGVSQQGVVAAHMMRQFGTSVGHAMDEPTHTDTATVNKSALIAPFLATYYGNGIGQEADGPLRTDTTKDRFGLITVEIEGQTYAIADIGMRMLTPRERFRAQGFPDSYVIDRRPDGSPISATVQGSCCGNSVCPPLAEALVSVNCGHLAAAREAAE